MLKRASDIIGLALYRSNGPAFLDGLLKDAVLRRKYAADAEMASVSPEAPPEVNYIDEQHKQNLNGQELQFAQERHELEMEKLKQELGHRQQLFDLKQLEALRRQQMQAQQSQAPAAPSPSPEQLAAQQAEQQRQNLMVAQQHPSTIPQQ